MSMGLSSSNRRNERIEFNACSFRKAIFSHMLLNASEHATCREVLVQWAGRSKDMLISREGIGASDKP